MTVKSRPRLILTALMLCGGLAAAPGRAAADTRVCFSPDQDCAADVAALIRSAQREVLIQAYNFTENRIYKAVADARRRGLTVTVILDKKYDTLKRKAPAYLMSQGVTLLVDDKVRVAHNKIVIVDRARVITGSFNFTEGASHNAENLLIIDEPKVVAAFVANFQRRAAASNRFLDPRNQKPSGDDDERD